MSKKTRGSQRTSHRRPGARPPTTATQRAVTPSTPIAQPVTTDVVTADVAAATAPTASASTASPVRTVHHRARAKPGSLLAAKAATEYVYVGQDLRRIVIVASVLFLILAILWIVLVVMGVSSLY